MLRPLLFHEQFYQNPINFSYPIYWRSTRFYNWKQPAVSVATPVETTLLDVLTAPYVSTATRRPLVPVFPGILGFLRLYTSSPERDTLSQNTNYLLVTTYTTICSPLPSRRPREGRVLGTRDRAAQTNRQQMTPNPSSSKNCRDKLTPRDVPLDVLPVVELTADEVKFAAELAADRAESYTEIDGGTIYSPEDTSARCHMKGVLSELAVAKLYNGDIDRDTYERGDKGFDVVIGEKRADVKGSATNCMDYPDLLVRPDKELTAELYLLVHILKWDDTGARMRVIGCAPKAQLEDVEPRQHPGSDENLVIPAERMSLPPLVQGAMEGTA